MYKDANALIMLAKALISNEISVMDMRILLFRSPSLAWR